MKRMISAVLIILLLFTGCGGNSVEQNSYQQIPQDAAKEMMDTQEVLILDVREQHEYDSGHIPGAVLLPVGTITKDTAADMIDDLDKWNDINELRKANPNLGTSVPVDYLLEEIAVAEGSLSKRSEFICKYACLKQNSSSAWIPSNLVEDASGDPIRLEDFKDCYCVGGLDLSQTRDLTACCVVIEKGGQLYVVSQLFLPTEKLDEAKQRDGVPYDIYLQQGFLKLSGDNFIDYHDCYNWFVDLVEKYQIYPLKIGFDRWSSQYLIQDLRAAGFHCDDVYQGDNLHGVIQETQGLLEDRKIHIGNNSLLKMHLLDSAIKMSVERGRGKLVKLSGNVHIDATAALLDAMTVRQKYYSEIGEQLKNEG